MLETYGVEISMIDWMTLGVPLAAIMLFSAWVILTKYVFQLHLSHLMKLKIIFKDMLNDLGPLSKDELKYQLFLV
jgi:sodium-dependent dicarboxylate transporter 2/3/5